MNEKLILFEFFHKLKNFTTSSYSAKKLQDLLEEALSRDDFDLSEINEWIATWRSTRLDIDKSLDEIEDVLNKVTFKTKVGLNG